MKLKKLRELNEKVLFLTSTLDAIIEDYCGKEDELIRKSLDGAWFKLSAALDNINYEVERKEKGIELADPVPVPDIDKETYKDLLRSLNVENVQEAHKITCFLCKELEGPEAEKLSHDARAAFVAAMLVEYGKRKARKKEPAQAAE